MVAARSAALPICLEGGKAACAQDALRHPRAMRT